MFRHVELLLGELSLGLERFDLFAVAAGPGSFTGLRVGLAAVKGWAEVYGKPIAAVSVWRRLLHRLVRPLGVAGPGARCAARASLFWALPATGCRLGHGVDARGRGVRRWRPMSFWQAIEATGGKIGILRS